MSWYGAGCMNKSRSDELKLVNCHLTNAKSYVNVLRTALLSNVQFLGLDSHFIFLQDNASCHTVKYTKELLLKMNDVADVLLDWPA